MYTYRSAYITLCRPISSHTGCNTFNIAKHERLGYKLAFQPDIFDMISASHLVSLLFVSPVDFVQFELLLLRMQRSLPQAPRRCEKDASEELFLKSSSSSEGETQRDNRVTGGRERERNYRQADTQTRNNCTYTASRHIMRQCSSNFKEKHRYIKNNRDEVGWRGNRGQMGG